MSAMPYKPALLKTVYDVEKATAGREASLEPKLDGWRGMAWITEDGPRLFARSGAELTGKLPEVEQELRESFPVDTVLDGEIASVGDEWGSVQSALGGGAVGPASPQARRPIIYVVFDVLRFAGRETIGLPYGQRREFLEHAFDELGPFDRIVLNPRFPATQQVHEAIVAEGYEGSVLKYHDSRYAPGSRGHGQFRLKQTYTMDVVVMGVVEGGGKRQGCVGSWTFGQYRDGVLVERGACGGGIAEAFSAECWERREDYVGRVFELEHYGMLGGPGGAARHPQFLRWREDRTAESVEWHDQ